jgi:uncharacterized membrane protein YeaQ/YmgE (transglycosylase-associated protein family)
VKKLKEFLLKLFKVVFKIIALDFKLRPDIVSTILLGVGTGIVANIMFVFTTTKNFDFISLTISFVLAIIILAIGSLERKDK